MRASVEDRGVKGQLAPTSREPFKSSKFELNSPCTSAKLSNLSTSKVVGTSISHGVKSCDCHMTCAGDSTPLMEAASGGYADIVKLLIGHGANVNAKSRYVCV